MAHFPALVRDLPPFTGPFDAFKLGAKDCDVLFASYPAGTVIKPHHHDTENVGVITQGELFLTLAGTESRYGPGEWCHIRAGHACRTLREGDFGDRILVLQEPQVIRDSKRADIGV